MLILKENGTRFLSLQVPFTFSIIKLNMWQSRVEIEHYSVVYFECNTAFVVPYRRTSVK